MADANPTARQRELSRHLRMPREQRNLTVNGVAELLLCSAAKISRIETAARKASLRDARDLCDLYQVTEAEKDQLMDLVRETREPGWWARYDDLGNADPTLAWSRKLSLLPITRWPSCMASCKLQATRAPSSGQEIP